MKTKTLPFAPTFLAVALGLAACGGTIAVDPITRDSGNGGSSSSSGGTSSSGDPPGTVSTPAPKAPIGPYAGLVGTTDVSILYPLPSGAQSKDFVRPAEIGSFGALFPKSAFDAVLPGGHGHLPVSVEVNSMGIVRVTIE